MNISIIIFLWKVLKITLQKKMNGLINMRKLLERLPALNLGRRKIRGSDLEKYIENYPVENQVIKESEIKVGRKVKI